MSREAEGGDATDSQDLRAHLADIAADLQAGTYRVGRWQAFVDAARDAPIQASRDLSQQISAVSNLVHARRKPRTYPLGVLTVIEVVLMLGGLFALVAGQRRESGTLIVIATAVLVLSLQPLIKAFCGRALGLGYSYGYTVNGEPRYKLAFGTYLSAPPARRVLFHLSGTLGSVLGLLVGAAACAQAHPRLGLLLFGLTSALAFVQVLFFVSAFAGRRRLPGVGALRMTSAGAAAEEMRAARRRQAQASADARDQIGQA